MIARYVPKTDRVARYKSDLFESDWPICLSLWKQGYDTLEIAVIMAAKEHEIYNILHRMRQQNVCKIHN